MLLAADTVKDFELGGAPPAGAAKRNNEAFRVSEFTAPAVTFRVTGTVNVDMPATTNIVPLHVAGALIPDALTAMVKFVGAGPAVKSADGVTVIQFAEAQVCLFTRIEAPVLKSAVTVSVWPAGADPPETALNVNCEGLTLILDEGTDITFIVTGMVCVPVDAVTWMAPVHVVPDVSPAWLTEIVKVVAVGPAVKFPDGVSDSQLLEVHVCSDACAIALVLVDAETESVNGLGADAPAGALKVNPVALNVRPARTGEETVRLTLVV
jgi:hypothetical protein